MFPISVLGFASSPQPTRTVVEITPFPVARRRAAGGCCFLSFPSSSLGTQKGEAPASRIGSSASGVRVRSRSFPETGPQAGAWGPEQTKLCFGKTKLRFTKTKLRFAGTKLCFTKTKLRFAGPSFVLPKPSFVLPEPSLVLPEQSVPLPEPGFILPTQSHFPFPRFAWERLGASFHLIFRVEQGEKGRMQGAQARE